MFNFEDMVSRLPRKNRIAGQQINYCTDIPELVRID